MTSVVMFRKQPDLETGRKTSSQISRLTEDWLLLISQLTINLAFELEGQHRFDQRTRVEVEGISLS